MGSLHTLDSCIINKTKMYIYSLIEGPTECKMLFIEIVQIEVTYE